MALFLLKINNIYVMNMELIKQLFDKYGIEGTLIALVILGLGSFLKSQWYSDKLSKLSDKLIEWFLEKKTSTKEAKQINESDILNHDVFNYIDFWVYSKIPTFQFSTEYRTIVFRKYLTIYFKCYKKGLSDFVKSGSYKSMDQAELWKSLMTMINIIAMDYEKESKDYGIPDIVISKMKLKNNDTIQLTIDLIESISNSQFCHSDNNYLKLYSILNIILPVLVNTISHSEPTCNSINGQLKGLSINDGGREVKEP